MVNSYLILKLTYDHEHRLQVNRFEG